MSDDDDDKKLESLDTSPTLMEPDYIDEGSSLEEIIKEDVQHSNNVLKGLYIGWGKVRTVSGICKMAITTMETVERRRKLMLKPASFTEKQNASKKDKNFGFEQIE